MSDECGDENIHVIGLELALVRVLPADRYYVELRTLGGIPLAACPRMYANQAEAKEAGLAMADASSRRSAGRPAPRAPRSRSSARSARPAGTGTSPATDTRGDDDGDAAEGQ
jgi:hypothetical protein